MPYTVLILIAILFSTANLVQAQAKYRATYRDSVPNNFHEIRAKMQAGELSFPEDSALIQNVDLSNFSSQEVEKFQMFSSILESSDTY